MTAINARRVLRSRAALAVFLILPLVLLHLGMSGRPALPSFPALADIKLPNPWSTSHDPDTQAELDALHTDSDGEKEVELASPHPHGDTSGHEAEGGRANHTYLPNGLLVPNPDAQHPIYDLVARAQEKWMRKLEGQSTTLKEAVDEYRRRYGRAPPKGFDNWFKWAKENGVKLLDEYDQIYKDLEPFYAIRPSTFRRVNEEGSKVRHGMYTITCKTKTDGSARCTEKVEPGGLEGEHLTVLKERSVAQLELIKPVQDMLEDVTAVFYFEDVPWQFVGYDFKNLLVEFAARGDYVSKEDMKEVDFTHRGWASGCEPGTPYRESYDPDVVVDLEGLWQTSPHSFIHDHKASMDVCINPELAQLMGVLAAHRKGPGAGRTMYPVMAMCKSTLNADVLAVSAEAWTEDVGDDPAWEDKKKDKLLWRGKTTGIFFKDTVNWNITQRINLVSHGTRKEGTLPVLPLKAAGEPVGKPELKEFAKLNSDLMDISFVEEAIQCEGNACQQLRDQFHFADRMQFTEANDYKYLLDVDGNGWSARFKRLLSTNSVVLKSTIFPEWYSDRIQPWLHYVPIKADLTDVYDVMTFFHDGHDDMAQQIAADGKEWSKTYWRQEDMVSYQFRLFLELSRLQSDNREAASYNDIPAGDSSSDPVAKGSEGEGTDESASD